MSDALKTLPNRGDPCWILKVCARGGFKEWSTTARAQQYTVNGRTGDNNYLGIEKIYEGGRGCFQAPPQSAVLFIGFTVGNVQPIPFLKKG